MNKVQWGIIGPGAIARNFATALEEAPAACLRGVAGRRKEKAQNFADENAVLVYEDACELLADPDVEAVYVATPHISHAQIAIDALRAGKHVLSEKPAGICPAEVQSVIEVAQASERFFAEGVMYLHHPQMARLRELLDGCAIGEVQHIEASFGFLAGSDPSSRLLDPNLGGGAIFDIGIYPLSFALWVTGQEPVDLRGGGVLAVTGVDAEAHAVATFKSGITASLAASIRRNMANDALIIGTEGVIRLDNPWTPGRNHGPSDTELHISDKSGARIETLSHPQMLFTFEAEAASQAVRAEALQLEACPWERSLSHARWLECWRGEIGPALKGPMPPRLNALLPKNAPPVPAIKLDGLEDTLSAMILGCDNQDRVENAGIVWDTFWEAGGNTFDTAYVYGGGRHETVLGQWLKSRGLQSEARVIAKGAHSPLCLPDVIEVQLNQSLDRLGLDRVPVYIMHRDNPDVPVGEFADALNRLKQAGRIGIFGGSNWTLERFVEANEYALANGLEPLRILNNNLSLAVMERPVWPGCMTTNKPEILTTLAEKQIAHLAWSSQARGYFLPEDLRFRLPEETSPEHCFGSDANEERRRRAEMLAEERGVLAHHVAAAWVLSQPFPSLALIGPRSAGELADSLKALELRLTAKERRWLNLQTDQR